MGKKKSRIPEGEFEARIEGLSHDFKGITRLNGKVHFIFGALPGELIRFKYLKVRSRFSEGIVTEVLEPSPYRATPFCPYFGSCGGCSLQHISPSHQLQLKEQMLLEQLQTFGGSAPYELLPPIDGPDRGYRRSARLGARFVQKKGGLLVGFRERYSHYIQEMESCPILRPEISGLIPRFRQILGRTSIPDEIPQIEVYAVENGVFCTIRHLSTFAQEDMELLRSLGRETGAYIFLQPKGPDSIHPLASTAPPTPYYELDTMSIKLHFAPGDFIQVNGVVNEKLIQCAIEFLGPSPDDTIFDFFCGIGNFTIPIAKCGAKEVVGIEVSEAMVKKAIQNSSLNCVQNTRFFSLDLTTDVKEILQLGPRPQKVLLDPPRSGAKELVMCLGETLRPKTIVYVSCSTATFSRDAGLLTQMGYTLKKVRVVNMFPHTSHAETIGLFRL